MNNGFLPVSRAEMEERGIKQFDFVYAIRSELSRSRTGEIRSLSVSSGSRGSGF